MESGYAYPGRSEDNPAMVWANARAETGVSKTNNIMVSSEVSRGHSNPATSCSLFKQAMRKSHGRTKDWMLELAKVIKKFMSPAKTTETHQRAACVRISRKLKVNHRRSWAGTCNQGEQSREWSFPLEAACKSLWYWWYADRWISWLP